MYVNLKLDKNDLQMLLEQEVLNVTFIKGNGERREMICTLNARYVPMLQYYDYAKTDDNNLILVWDIQNRGWRSFHLDSVIECTLIPQYT